MTLAPNIPSFELKTLRNGKSVLFLMATAAEYLANLKQVFVPAIIGVGPVEAALNTGLILSALEKKPDATILLGSAGSAVLGQGSVYQATSIAYRDMDASPLGFPKGQTPFLDQPPIINMPISIPGLAQASLSTGANIVITDGFGGIAQEMVDMESYAVVRVCQAYQTDLIVLRGISDGSEELEVYEDWTALLPTVDKNLAAAVAVTLSYLETT